MKLVKDTDQLETKKHEISDEKAEEAIKKLFRGLEKIPNEKECY